MHQPKNNKTITISMNDKRRCSNAILPAVVYAITLDAIKLGKDEKEKESLIRINTIAKTVYAAYANCFKLEKRVSKRVHEILKLFVDARDGTYHIRKVILALYNATQEAYNMSLIKKDSALVVQDALNLEGKLPMNEDAWFKLKSSADKKVDDIVKIIIDC